MGASSRSMIAIFLIAVFLLVGCASPDLPAPVPTRPAETEPIPIVGINTPSPSTPTSTIPPALPTEPQVDLSDLSDFPVLAPENLEQIAYLGARSLAGDQTEMKIRTYDWSDDGERIVACTISNESSSYQVIDLSGSTSLAEIQLQPDFCRTKLISAEWLQFSRDGDQFLGLREIEDGGYDVRPAVYDSLSGELLATLTEHPVDPRFSPVATFSSRGTRLALTRYVISPAPPEEPNADVQAGFSSVAAVAIELYDAQSGDYWGTFLEITNDSISDLEYSTNGEYLVAGMETTFAWHVAGENTLEVDCPFGGITFSPVAEAAALTCFPREGKPFSLVWDLIGDEVIRLEEAPGDYYQQFRFSPNGELLIGLAGYGEVSIWYSELGNLLITLSDTYPEAIDASFTGEGRFVAVLFDDGSLKYFGVK
jgi:WD40 repeat protein